MAHNPFDQPLLFNPRVLAKALGESPPAPIPIEHQQLLHDWAQTIRDGSIRQRSERQIRSSFVHKFFVDLLGYTAFGGQGNFTVTEEARAGTGAADIALGHFGPQGDRVLVPVELKGAQTHNLDVMMAGRYKSPVQQVWEYAMDIPHARFLVLSNMLEIRLYAVGHTRRVYERFDLLTVASSPREYHRLQLLLGAPNLLGGRTAQLLQDSRAAEIEITRALYADYKSWRIQLIVALAQANDLLPGQLIGPAQKLLDRVLFVAFAQQRGLLPKDTLKDVHSSVSAWNPTPLYHAYRGLFRAIDQGLPQRNIPPYNGGLFAPDALLDAQLQVPDSACDVFQEFSRYDFGGEVSVNVLGHIFEQSISDLEELQALADSGGFTLEAIQAQLQSTRRTGVAGARKTHGIVYTPEFITAFIVEQTLDKTLVERRQYCSSSYQLESESEAEAAWRKPTPDEKKYAKSLAQPERVVELAFWRAWLAELTSIKVCDPACGSGAFLVAAFDVLLAEYNNVNEQIAAITGSMEVFNADREILNSNLFGVDLNAESIEITKLSLWLKTAKHGKPLESLEASLRVGNSIISSADGGLAYDPKAFDWATNFPDVVARGGFDVVIGNPPYVRQERISPFKPYLQKRYACFDGAADLYAYFFELGIRLLRNGNAGGRIGFVSSSTFFKSASGQNLRSYLLKNAHIESVVDFADLQVFEGVTTYPVVISLRRSGAPDPDHLVRFLSLTHSIPDKLGETFTETAAAMAQSQLGDGSWRLEDSRVAHLRAKLLDGHRSLQVVYGAPLYGLKTGLNEAFVLDVASHQQLAHDPASQALLKPFLRGENLKPWRVEPQGEWLLHIKNGSTRALLKLPANQPLPEPDAWAAFRNAHPAAAAWLAPFEARARQRTDQGEFWWELRACAYDAQFDRPKIVYVDMSDKPNFSLDSSGAVLANTAYFVPAGDAYLLALLNSKALWFLLRGMTTAYRGGYYRLFTQHVQTLPVPEAAPDDRAGLTALADQAQTAATARHADIRRFGHQVLRDFAPGGVDGAAKLGDVLGGQTGGLPAFADFSAEIKKRFKRELNLSERNDWDAALAAARTRVQAHTQTIAQCEREINAVVNRLFGLTPQEIALLG